MTWGVSSDDDEYCANCIKIKPCADHKCAKPECMRFFDEDSKQHFCAFHSCEFFGCDNYPKNHPDCRVHNKGGLFGGDD
jgi:hypothetical protein